MSENILGSEESQNHHFKARLVKKSSTGDGFDIAMKIDQFLSTRHYNIIIQLETKDRKIRKRWDFCV